MEALGINWLNMVIYSIMFGIIFYAIKSKLVPKLDNALSERQKEIEKSLALSKKAEADQQDFALKRDKESKKIQLENKEKMESIIQKANQEAKEIIADAKSKAKEIIKNGEVLVEKDRLKLDQELEAKISSMVKKGILWTKK